MREVRYSRAWFECLLDDGVHIVAESARIHGWRTGDRRQQRIASDESTAPNRTKLADRHTLSRDDEVLAPIQRTHDLSAVVAKFSLGDGAGHVRDRSTCATFSGVV